MSFVCRIDRIRSIAVCRRPVNSHIAHTYRYCELRSTDFKERTLHRGRMLNVWSGLEGMEHGEGAEKKPYDVRHL